MYYIKLQQFRNNEISLNAWIAFCEVYFIEMLESPEVKAIMIRLKNRG